MLIMLFLLLCLPVNSYASQLIYTLQAGSFLSIDNAQKQFDSLAQLFNEKELDHFRIEKIGKYYSVRLGKFDKRSDVEQSLSSMKDRSTSFLIVEAYYKEERIEKLYVPTKTETDAPQTLAEPLKRPLPVNIQPQVAENVVDKADKKAEATSEEQKIEATSDAVEKKRYEDALEVVKAGLAERPEDPEFNGRYGTILFRLKKPAEAIPYLKKAAELSPRVPEYHSYIGYCFLLLSKFNEAVEEFNRAVTISPSHVGALAGLGISYSELGEKDKAMHVYDKLKTLDSALTKILLQIIEET
jgi:tetratricopeptide (TPR) repeat protein